MARCRAITNAGKRCKNQAVSGEDYCSLHKNKNSIRILAPLIGGALIGNLLAPGIGGAIVGGLVGAITGSLSEKGGGQKEDD